MNGNSQIVYLISLILAGRFLGDNGIEGSANFKFNFLMESFLAS